ncbi:MAG: hypothetical protein JSR48_10420 [Verrucomicrobia bacterium]|nr:hypothetical protein [Verrucomicrobiota bacterium]
MPMPEQTFRWTWNFRSPPEALWPLVSNTDRFNRDCGYPAVEVRPSPTAHRRLRARVMGLVIDWEEQAFEWQEPWRFSVHRIYSSGPVARMIMGCELAPRADGGTTLTYEMRLRPSGWIGRLALPFSIGRQVRAVTERVLRRYDEFAAQGLRVSELAQRPRLVAGARGRIESIRTRLHREAAQPEPLTARLVDFVTGADDLACQRIRPYALAYQWRADRRQTLQLFLHATRTGLLDFHWDVLCPHCRGAKSTVTTLGALEPAVHCDSCRLDFTADFDQSVELTFTPNRAIRDVPHLDYCVGGPQVTPHIVAQQRLAPADRQPFVLAFRPGRYRVRAPGLPRPQAFRIESGAPPAAEINLGPGAGDEIVVAPGGRLTLANPKDNPQLAVIEHVEWSDQSTTAAEVTALQLFRDLFSREVLRPGSQVSVGAMTVAFTDLKNSTRLYKDIGDAPAFGRVLTHFEVLRAAIAPEGGAIVKTMGDAVMAVFPQPAGALRALVRAQQLLARPDAVPLPAGIRAAHAPHPLVLKAGLHHGPCIAINQNERLDYFGTTVNLAARLCAQAAGDDIILSDAVRADAAVAELLEEHGPVLGTDHELVRLKGFGDEEFAVWHLRARADLTQHPFWRL